MDVYKAYSGRYLYAVKYVFFYLEYYFMAVMTGHGRWRLKPETIRVAWLTSWVSFCLSVNQCAVICHIDQLSHISNDSLNNNEIYGSERHSKYVTLKPLFSQCCSERSKKCYSQSLQFGLVFFFNIVNTENYIYYCKLNNA